MSTVTIIIPCYNASKYIRKCLIKLENQTYKDFQVICVDDASQDDTIDTINICKNDLSYDVEIVSCKKNSGPASARNLGIQKAHSKYITFCDSDDWYESNFLEEMLETIKSNNAQVAFCGYQVIDKSGKKNKRPLKTEKTCLTSIEALSLNADSLCMMMVETEIMKKIQLPAIRNGEDMCVIPLIIMLAERCAVVKQPLYNYYRRNGSASETPSLNVVESLRIAYNYTKKNISIDKYYSQLEFLGIRNYIYSSMITLFSFTYDKDRANAILYDFEKDFPNWSKNRYIKSLPKYKKIILVLIKYHLFILLRALMLLKKYF